LLRLLLALPPVLAFLAVLVVIDSFKLVPLRAVARSLAAGAVAALASWYLNVALLGAGLLPEPAFSRYVSPLVEESLKALYLVYLLRRHRVGFLVDAAIHGFAVGAGFALVENIYYLSSVAGGGLPLWVVRGFGTALLHGGTTSVFAMMSKALADRRPSSRVAVFLPGGMVALAVHSFFNHFILHALLATTLLLVALPLLMIAVFERSRRATRGWLSAGFTGDLDFLGTILLGEVGPTRVGEYLRSLTARFPAPVVADMLCLIRIDLELSLRGKGILIAREAGLHLPVGEDVRANLEELKYLEKAIGPTGLLAIRPLLKSSRHDRWHLYMLEEAGAGAADGRRAGD
jgi:RsiW-degrading membrane proteinase PrsW (M82 family)